MFARRLFARMRARARFRHARTHRQAGQARAPGPLKASAPRAARPYGLPPAARTLTDVRPCGAGAGVGAGAGAGWGGRHPALCSRALARRRVTDSGCPGRLASSETEDASRRPRRGPRRGRPRLALRARHRGRVRSRAPVGGPALCRGPGRRSILNKHGNRVHLNWG